MATNPVLKPKLATPALILSSAAAIICVTGLFVTAVGQPTLVWSLATGISVILAFTVVAVWLMRTRRVRAWAVATNEKWKQLEGLKQAAGTTTEVTVLSVDALEPTGSWITIKWNRFDHVQAAWLEALPEPIWPGSVLLIAPDPAQVRPGVPWPATYLIQASRCLGWAPAMKALPPARTRR